MIDATKHLKLAKWYAWKFIRKRDHLRNWYDDVVGEARVALERAAAKYDPKRGCKFSTLAVVCMRRQLVRMFDNKAMAEEWEPLPNIWIDVDEIARTDYRLDIEMIVEICLNRLPGRERQVIELRLQDKSLDDVGRVLGVTCERIRQIEAKAIRKLRERLRSFEVEICQLIEEGANECPM